MTTEMKPQIALPEGLEVPPDRLRFRLDVYDETILLHHFGEDGTTTAMVSALDVARALAAEIRFHSGILPPETLWWGTGREGDQVALWRGPRVWRVALVLEPFQPPRRFDLPLPGLVFICAAGRPPQVYAAPRRPRSVLATLYHAPLYNLFSNGTSCAGTHHYGQNVSQQPEEFFTAFFTRAGHPDGRSQRHPHNLLALWEELDGKRRFPVVDLVPLGTVEEVMELRP